MNTVEQIRKFMEPRSVALVGVSRRTGPGAFNILENLLGYSYRGDIYPVNPNATKILGIETYSRVADIPNPVDLAVINLPRRQVPASVSECIDHRIMAIIIVTQGFTDATDAEGKRLQREIDQLAQQSGARILGPNTFGTANAGTSFSSSYVKLDMARIPVGIVSQTGIFFVGLHDLQVIGKGIDLGNSCDVDFADAMEYFAADDETKVVALYIEGITDGQRFVEVARRLARKKPVIALKSGKCAAAAVRSHTGSLVGSDEIWESALAQSGVIRARSIDELADLVRAFPRLPLMRGNRIAITTNSGALGIICIDACYRFDLEVARLSPATIKRISAFTPPWQGLTNPLDIIPATIVLKHPYSQVMPEFMEALFSDDHVDAVLVISPAPNAPRSADLMKILQQMVAVYPGKPLVCSFNGPHAAATGRRLESNDKLVCFYHPDRAIRALAGISHYSAFRRSL